MRKFLSTSVLVLLLLTCLSLVGCGGQKETTSQPAGNAPAAGQPAKDDLMASLLAKGKQVEGLSYDYAMTAEDVTMNGKVWMQGGKMKSEMTVDGQQVISIFDGDSYYTYNPVENTAFKITPDKSSQVETPTDYTEDLESKPDQVKVLETTVYDGVKCVVVMVTAADGKEQMKMWLHEEYGVPLRVEATNEDGSKSLLEYKNLKVGPQPPETFQLPAGVEITDMNEMMKDMPQMPGDKH